MPKKEARPWPQNCVWPKPVEDVECYYWEAEDAESLPLDQAGEELLEIKEYMDGLVEEGRLNEDYSLNADFEEREDREPGGNFTPAKGEEYWSADGFHYDFWREDMVAHLNNIKLPLPSPVDEIQRIIGYEFINENILRQAFTRQAFSAEYGTGNNEVLEFYGDNVLNTVVTRELARQTADIESSNPQEPFTSGYNEGELTHIKQHYVNKEYLAGRAAVLGLDKYILYGTGEEANESTRENMMEALIGAAAVDSGWDWYALDAAVDRLICFQVNKNLLKPSFYDLLNSWHQKHFGRMPEYELSKGMPANSSLTEYKYLCTLRYRIPENDKGIWTSQRLDVQRETRSMARECAAEEAYYFLVANGLWMNLKESGIVPELDNAINQLQELYQKKYVEQPEYKFEDKDDGWRCYCRCSGCEGRGKANSKTLAKKKAAFMVLVRLMMSAGLATEEMKTAMYNGYV